MKAPRDVFLFSCFMMGILKNLTLVADFNFSFIPPNINDNNTDADISLYIEGSGTKNYGIEDTQGDYIFSE